MQKINLLMNLPYNNLYSFMKTNGKDIGIKEVVSAHAFIRTFELSLNDEKTIKLRIDMSINNDGDDTFFISFNSKVFYKDAYNQNYETYYIFNNYEKFSELSQYLDSQIETYLLFSEMHNIEVMISESISDDIFRIGEKQLSEITLISKQAELFKKYVDNGIEKASIESSLIVDTHSFPQDNSQGNFTKDEIDEINNLFDSIKDSVQQQIKSSTDYSIPLESELEESEITFAEEEFLHFLQNPSEEILAELIDESLDEGNIERFMYYSELLNAKKQKKD